MVLGFRGLRSLVLASSTAQFLARDFSVYGHCGKGLWLHALTTATASRTLAREIRLGAIAAEELFVAGLLHDVGKMLVAPYLQEVKFHQLTDRAIEQLERDTVGVDHTEAGALVCAKWNLSTEMQIIVKAHHDSEEAEECQRAAALTRVADAYAHELGHGYARGHAPDPVYLDVDFDLLGLNSKLWREAKERIDFHVESALSSLNDICS
jgi:putative nucleotidyltransferase with HDIG domain